MIFSTKASDNSIIKTRIESKSSEHVWPYYNVVLDLDLHREKFSSYYGYSREVITNSLLKTENKNRLRITKIGVKHTPRKIQAEVDPIRKWKFENTRTSLIRAILVG